MFIWVQYKGQGFKEVLPWIFAALTSLQLTPQATGDRDKSCDHKSPPAAGLLDEAKGARPWEEVNSSKALGGVTARGESCPGSSSQRETWQTEPQAWPLQRSGRIPFY